jgi:SAM-dependent methyltransferase
VKEVPNCPICGSSKVKKAFILHDDRYGFEGSFDLYACEDACRHRWLHWLPDRNTLSDLYTNYYPRSKKTIADFHPLSFSKGVRAWWSGQRSSASSWVPERVRVLDIGCGFGESLAYHRGRGCDVYGVEADGNIARVAEHFGFKVHVGLFDSSRYEPDFFEYVTMDQVLEHATDPVEMLMSVKKVLKKGGKLILTTPNGNGMAANLFGRRWINWHTPYHLHLFSRDSLRLVADRAGLIVEEIKTVTSSEWLSYQWIHFALFPAQGARSQFWHPGDQRFPARMIIKALRAYHRLGVDHMITRVLDACGAGDNLVARIRK